MRPDEIAALLARAIRERVLAPGMALNQDELAKQFDVSRIPLREALRTLVGEGLVVMKPGLGAVVTELSVEEVVELYFLRSILEPPLAPFIVMHMRRRDVDDLAEIAATMVARKQKDFKDWWSDNYRFLRRLYEISERPHTTRLVVQVLNLVEPYGNIRAHSSEVRLRVQDQRKAMLDALRSTDADLLSSLIADSIEAAQKELLASMGASGAPDDPLKRLRRV